MDIILKQANLFAENYFNGGGSRYQEILDAATDKVSAIDNPLDKIKFLNVVLEKSNSEYEKHKPVCRDPENCSKNFAYENIAYFLTQELNRLGVHFNDDTFSDTDRQAAESKLDKILSQLADLKMGQEIIYEDLTKEISELKELYFLGKKKWYQLLIGKSTEMVASGIVSETVAKQIINTFKATSSNLLGQ
ncbi:MAG: hypothetical protein V4722_06890 [Bacteroidota bacterium]